MAASAPLVLLSAAGASAASSSTPTRHVDHARYEHLVYETLAGRPPHPQAHALLAIVAAAAAADAEAALDVRADDAWLYDELRALGFTRLTDGAVRPPPDASGLLSLHNAARRRVHADAETRRRRLLEEALVAPTPPPAARDARRRLGPARAMLHRLARDADGAPALWPILGGGAALLRAQAAAKEAQAWRCSREALLNGGDDMVPVLIRTLRDLGLSLGQVRDLEEGEGGDSTEWIIERGAWTRPELAALACVIERLREKCGGGNLKTGSVRGLGGVGFEAAAVGDWPSWALMAVHAWVVRLLG